MFILAVRLFRRPALNMPEPKPVLRSADAENDLIRLWLHIAEHNPNAADRYIRRIQQACEGISQFPDKGTPRPDLGINCCKLVIGDYLIFTIILTTAWSSFGFFTAKKMLILQS